MRVVWIGAGLAVAAMAVFGGWRWGAAQVEAAIDDRIARLEQDGVTVSYASRAVGGFPTGYRVALEQVTVTGPNGEALALPQIEADSALFSREITAQLPQTAVLSWPIEGEPPLQIDITLENAAQTSAMDGGAFAMTADAITLALRPDAARPEFRRYEGVLEAVSITGMRDLAAALLDAQVDAARFESKVEIDLNEMEPRFDSAASAIMAQSMTAEDVRIELAGVPYAEPKRLLAPDAKARMVFAVARQTGDGAQPFAPGAPPIPFSVRSGESRAEIGIDGQRFALSGDGVDGELSYDLSALEMPEVVLTMPRYETRMTGPLDPQARNAPFSLNLLLDQVTVNEAALDQLDPQKMLARAPMKLDVELGGEIDMHGVQQDAPPPDVHRLDIARAYLTAFGAEAKVTGMVKPMGDPAGPVGQVTAKAKGWTKLLEFARAMGLVQDQAAGFAMVMAQQYADPDAGGDALSAQIEMKGAEVYVNGQRVK